MLDPRAARLLVVLLLGAGPACSFPNHRHDLRVNETVPTGGDGFAHALYQSVGAEMRHGNAVDLVDDGRIFDVMEEEILRARSSIHIVTFIWRGSAPSDRLVKAILSRTREGVACRVVVDPLGSIRFDEDVRLTLSRGGCDVRIFRPVKLSSPFRVALRNHRKILVVDGRSAVTGGFGIWKSWLGNGMKTEEWRDTNVRVRGPAVREMQLAFTENWQEAGGALLPPDVFPELAHEGQVRAAFVRSTGTLTLSAAERMTLLVIAAAKRRIWIENSYFIPSTAIGDMLIEKAKRGVDVRVLAPGRVHDIPPVRAAQRSTYQRLLERGVRIWEYQPSMMHAKTMLVDDRLIVVGSTNLDPLSLKKLEEGSLVAEDMALAMELERRFLVDLTHSAEMRADNWMNRGLLEKLSRKLTWWIGAFL